jgi:trans-aconitate methyltransferase
MKEKGYTSILDIGCGNGRFLEYMKQNAMSISQYLGTDSSAGMIDEARSIYPEHTFAVQDMQDIHTDGTYDAIVFLASFHHLDTLQSRVHTLQHIAKNLKK